MVTMLMAGAVAVLLGCLAPRADAALYWSNNSTDAIGHAAQDGTGANQSFVARANQPNGVAVDGQYGYWANRGNGSIGRAKLDGSGAQQDFITGVGEPIGLAVDGTYVYWGD